MNVPLVGAVLLAWPLVVAILFRAVGPRRAVLIGLLGGQLFLPAGQIPMGPSGFIFPVDKWNVSGLGLLLGVLIFDRRSLLRARPGWVDLPMALYYLSPLIGLATGIPGSGPDILDAMIGRGLGWVVPYVMGRVYFGSTGGPSMVLIALTIAGLSYIPVCLYEVVVGPSRYLSPLIYQTAVDEGTTGRLGGWRPVGFLNSGLEVAAWMAMTTVMAAWLALGGWRIPRWPSAAAAMAWVPPVALLATTLSCRGIYGYVILAVGLSAAVLTRYLRSRALLVILLALAVIYMGLRGSGVWDGQLLVSVSGFTGRASTVEFRLSAESELIHRVIDHNLWFGFGNYVWHAGLSHWPDGVWLHGLWTGGLVGLTIQIVALYLWPSTLALGRPQGRPDRRQAASPTWGLAIWCILSMIDGMHNACYFTPTALVIGALVGSYVSSTSHVGFSGGPIRDDRPPWPLPVPLLVTVILLAVIEFLGRSPRSSPPPTNPPVSGDESRNPSP